MNNKNLALRILLKRMERIPEIMRLEIIKKLDEIGTQVPAGRTPMDRPGSDPVKEAGMLLEALKQSVGLPPSLGDRPASNPVKETGELLEAVEHVVRFCKERHASDRAQPQ
jgi:hypothetical protein